MMWFYKLKRAVRVIIAVAAWLPALVFCGIMGGNGSENVQTWQAVVTLLLLAVGVVFTVFAVKARGREKQAERAAQAAARPAERKTASKTPSAIDVERERIQNELAANKEKQAQLRAQIAAMEQAEPTIAARAHAPDTGVTVRINDGVSLPIFTKAVGVTFDNCQSVIQDSNIGDAVLIKHNPTDEYPNSTDIINVRTGGRIGRVNSDLSWSLLNEFDDGFVLDGEIKDITGGGIGQNFGCNITITGEHCDE